MAGTYRAWEKAARGAVDLARRFTRDTLRDVLESYLIPQEEKTSTVRRGLSFLRGKRAVKK